ncbi:hypothetical protein ACS0TY_030056 [Phlomoides rotata]
MIILIKRSDNADSGRRPRVTIACERSEGEEDKMAIGRRSTEIKKYGCQFMLQGNQIGSKCQWELKVVCGTHNHLIDQFLEGHTYVGRLTPSQDAFMLNFSMINSLPLQILDVLKKEWLNTKAMLRHIYNARLKHRVVKRKGQSQM